MEYTLDLPTILGSNNVYAGFTSGTGAGFGNHDILAWQFNSSFNPINDIRDVPEPSTTILFGLMLASLLFRRLSFAKRSRI